MTPAAQLARPGEEEVTAIVTDQTHASAPADLRYDFTLPTAHVTSVPRSRAEVDQVLSSWGLATHPIRDAVLLIVSELVTNAVRHAAVCSSAVDVALAMADGQLDVAVHDRHPHRPRALPTPREDGDGGFGLHLVQHLAVEAGGSTAVPADPDGGGKTVTVTLPL
ncbi:ATP-binding protein [Streptomyces sp. 891-h]|uniref:ATP-binding protein n=1 Tax=Streptomyces sp. 891-h TaxID=2720714 RepID=UPI001FAA39F8|nr:ATP-binding protein [Streptomyces sp. 891-h]UNZ21303.1 ATP-binding protein [Streptomyces sp. 891-h]